MRYKNHRDLVLVGDTVELLEDTEPYYSGYGINPKCIVKAGTLGTVGSVDVPCTTRPLKNGRLSGEVCFACVDFFLPGVYAGNPEHGNNKWRCGVSPRALKLKERKTTNGKES